MRSGSTSKPSHQRRHANSSSCFVPNAIARFEASAPPYRPGSAPANYVHRSGRGTVRRSNDDDEVAPIGLVLSRAGEAQIIKDVWVGSHDHGSSFQSPLDLSFALGEN